MVERTYTIVTGETAQGQESAIYFDGVLQRVGTYQQVQGVYETLLVLGPILNQPDGVVVESFRMRYGIEEYPNSFGQLLNMTTLVDAVTENFGA